jgi:hypothetical protein
MTAIYVNSATASSTSQRGSFVTLNFRDPLDISGKRVRLLKSSIWYTMPNISAEKLNNKIKFTYDGTIYTFVFADGQYSLDDIIERLGEFLQIEGLPTTLIDFVPDEATAKITLKVVTALQFTWDFEDADNRLTKAMLGFTGNVTQNVSFFLESTNIARINELNNIYVHSTLSNDSILNNNSQSTILCSIPINNSPGSLMLYEPANTVSSKCHGASVNMVSIWLTDELGNPLDMFGETFSLVLEIF